MQGALAVAYWVRSTGQYSLCVRRKPFLSVLEQNRFFAFLLVLKYLVPSIIATAGVYIWVTAVAALQVIALRVPFLTFVLAVFFLKFH